MHEKGHFANHSRALKCVLKVKCLVPATNIPKLELFSNRFPKYSLFFHCSDKQIVPPQNHGSANIAGQKFQMSNI